jgi:hypothetical protein
MKLVATNRGLIPRDELELSVIQTESYNAVEIATVWRLKAEGPDAPHVRRDASIVFLAPAEIQVQAESLTAVPPRITAQEAAARAAAAAQPPPPSPAGADVTVGLQGQQIGTEQSNIR